MLFSTLPSRSPSLALRPHAPVTLSASRFNALSVFAVLAVVVLALCLPDSAFAATGTTLPWDSKLQALVKSINGPVAFAISVIGIIGIGATLIFGGDMNGLLRSGILFVAVVALIGGASPMVSGWFGVNGAELTEYVSVLRGQVV